MHCPRDSCPPLPERIEFPESSEHRQLDYVIASARALPGVTVARSKALAISRERTVEIAVDGTTARLDLGDWPQMPADYWRYPGQPWLKKSWTPALVRFGHVYSLPKSGFLDYSVLDALGSCRYEARGTAVVARMRMYEDEQTHRARDLRARRSRAVDRLSGAFASDVRTGYVDDDARFLRECLAARVVVHVPGSHAHILDRTVVQLFALGVCVVSPEIWDYCGRCRPEPGEHYVRVRDDLADLVEAVERCRQDRARCVRTGGRAQAFYEDHLSPGSVWSYVQRCLQRAGDPLPPTLPERQNA